MTTSELPILASESEDTEMRAALTAGWARYDLRWERLQEQGNTCFEQGNLAGAARNWRRASWISFFRMSLRDPRRATSLANLALLDRQAGREARARKRYAKALSLWSCAPDYIGSMTVARRARSSLFHLRMETLHWDTYQDNLHTRYRAFAAETAGALDAMSRGEPATCRLFGRWRGEKPSIYDDSRKFLSAALLVGGGTGQDGNNSLRANVT